MLPAEFSFLATDMYNRGDVGMEKQQDKLSEKGDSEQLQAGQGWIL